MAARSLDVFLNHEASTSHTGQLIKEQLNDYQSGPLIPDNIAPLLPPDPIQVPTSDEKLPVYSDGRTPLPDQFSQTFRNAHPPHQPTGTSEVLTFYPTMEEFKDFQGYIKKIESVGAHLKSGIAKIVAPEGWHPRPSKPRNDYSDVDDYILKDPVLETIEKRGGSHLYKKYNKVYKKKMTVSEYRKLANSAKYKNPKPQLEGIELESEYFKNILDGEPIYGADSEGSIYDPDVNEFNMNRLGTVLDEMKQEKIPGVNTVYMYFGMHKTTFPWHSEDMDLYSINFLHFGAPKYWFAISSESAYRFERLMNQSFHGDDPTCPAYLRHKLYIVTPALLRQHNIPYSTMIQRPNEFIITFPKGYHMGFNTGYNCAESTNFASDRWIDYGKNALVCKCQKGAVELNMKHFMEKYRPLEYQQWYDYWYSERIIIKNLKRKKRQVSKKEIDEYKKRARHELDELMKGTGSSISDVSPSNSFSTFGIEMIAKNYDISGAMQQMNSLGSNYHFRKLNKDLMSDHIPDLFAEKVDNTLKSKHWPHCSVCSYFQPVHMQPRCSDVPKSSRRLVNSWVFSTNESQKEGKHVKEEIDDLLTCDNCLVTVHSGCCSGEKVIDGVPWKCLRCRTGSDEVIRGSTCHLCNLRGGCLIPCQNGLDRTFVHVICAIFSRKSTFDRCWGPTTSWSVPPLKQKSLGSSIPPLAFSNKYEEEYGEQYDQAKWKCDICSTTREGLIHCSMCIEEQSLTKSISFAHVTCARDAGYLLEVRQFPKNTAMICQQHLVSHLINKNSSGVHVKVGDEVFAQLNDSKPEKGKIQLIVKKPTIVVDWLDGSVSHDLLTTDILSCGCLTCDKFEHQYGSRVKVSWDDGQVYDAYFRGNTETPEYHVALQSGPMNGSVHVLPRNKLLSKREMSQHMKRGSLPIALN